MEAAFGASLAGSRSFCAMKHVGLNVAADPLFTLAYTGINAGLVIAVADDAGMHSSQNEQDSRYYALSAKIPMLEPSNSQEALDFTKTAFEVSEKFDTPVLLKMCTRVSHTQSLVKCGSRHQHIKEYKKDAQKYVMVPAMARRKHPILETKIDSLQEWSNTAKINFIDAGQDSSLGIITDSTSYQYVKEVFGDKHPVLKIGMVFPFPDKLAIEFSKQVEKLIVVEELGPFIETQIKSLGITCKGKELFSAVGELSQRSIAKSLNLNVPEGKKFEEETPVRPPSLCAGCPHRGVF